jgi:hypothetical protein
VMIFTPRINFEWENACGILSCLKPLSWRLKHLYQVTYWVGNFTQSWLIWPLMMAILGEHKNCLWIL